MLDDKETARHGERRPDKREVQNLLTGPRRQEGEPVALKDHLSLIQITSYHMQ